MKAIPVLAKSSYHTLCLDFDGVFTSNKVLVDRTGAEFVQCSRGDGLGFDLLKAYLKKHHVLLNIIILSRESNSVVSSRASKLGLECFHPVKNKHQFLSTLFQDNPTLFPGGFEGLIYLGNDLNDLQCILSAGFSICPSDSHPLVIEHSDCIHNRNGGDDFVRCVLESLIDLPRLGISEIITMLS